MFVPRRRGSIFWSVKMAQLSLCSQMQLLPWGVHSAPGAGSLHFQSFRDHEDSEGPLHHRCRNCNAGPWVPDRQSVVHSTTGWLAFWGIAGVAWHRPQKVRRAPPLSSSRGPRDVLEERREGREGVLAGGRGGRGSRQNPPPPEVSGLKSHRKFPSKKPRKFCHRGPKRTVLHKIALKVSGLHHTLGEREGGGPPPLRVRHSKTSQRRPLPRGVGLWRGAMQILCTVHTMPPWVVHTCLRADAYPTRVWQTGVLWFQTLQLKCRVQLFAAKIRRTEACTTPRAEHLTVSVTVGHKVKVHPGYDSPDSTNTLVRPAGGSRRNVSVQRSEAQGLRIPAQPH